VAFLFVGGGAKKALIEQEIAERGLNNCELRLYQPREMLAQSLSVPDVHVVSLLPELEGLIVPSKIYGVLAAGRPVLFIGDPNGEIGQLVSKEGVGFAVEPGDAAALEERIRWLATESEQREAMGRRARQVFEERFDRSIALETWQRVISAGPDG
jgi:glycosyltransferase involved in cell wall biosynthesis